MFLTPIQLFRESVYTDRPTLTTSLQSARTTASDIDDEAKANRCQSKTA